MKMIFCSSANKTHLHKKGFALNLVLKVRVFGILACENIRFSTLFAAPRETSPAAKSEEKRMFSQAIGTREWPILTDNYFFQY